MTGNVTWEMVSVLIILIGALSGVWWRIEARIDKVRVDAEDEIADLRQQYEIKIQGAHTVAALALQQLAEFKVEVAQTYVDKTGVREVKDEILAAMRDVKGSVDNVNERLDRVIEGAAKPHRARTA